MTQGAHWSFEQEEQLIGWYKEGVTYQEMSRKLGGVRSASACESKVREMRVRGRVEANTRRNKPVEKLDHWLEGGDHGPWARHREDLFQLWERANNAPKGIPS